MKKETRRVIQKLFIDSRQEAIKNIKANEEDALFWRTRLRILRRAEQDFFNHIKSNL